MEEKCSFDWRSERVPLVFQSYMAIDADFSPEGCRGPGMFAIVSLEIGRRERVLMVHKDALVLGGGGQEVFTFHPVSPPDPKNPDLGEVRKVSVKLGVQHEEWIQVEGDLEKGDEIVVQGNERLRDRQRVMRSRPEPRSTPLAVRPTTRH